MDKIRSIKSQIFGPGEYKWIPVLYASYFLTLIGWIVFVPAEESMTMQVIILMTLVYVAALAGTQVRALQRIEERLAQLG
jgi:hypothetical protein